MKKLVVLLVFLYSCSSPETPEAETIIQDSTIVLDTTVISDSLFTHMKELIKSTENADRKVREIKGIKSENASLKKELVETKEDLKEANLKIKTLDSAIKTTEKKGFIRKMIDSISKDSTQN